jgi:serine/threonine-protein kinase
MRPSAEETLILTITGGRSGVALPTGPLPATLGRYQILDALGKGAMGVVYRARDPMINREVALKAIPLADEFEGRELEEARGRFFREAEMAGRLSHPHIVTIFDAGEDDGMAYIAMELLRGRPLVEHTQPDRLLPLSVAVDIVGRLADALHFAHQRQVVHRDIKPANVMYDPPGAELRSRISVSPGSPTPPARARGGPGHTVVHVARAASGSRGYGPVRSVLAGGHFLSASHRATALLRRFDAGAMLKIVQDPHPRIRAIRPDLPEKLDAFFERSLAKEPVDRFESGAAFAAALRQIGGAIRD